MRLLVRTWNLFHGRAVPAGRGAFVEDAVRLAATGEPDVVCLQEVPPWALPRLGEWSGMASFPAVTTPPRAGPLGRRLTELDSMRIRSALTGQANTILVSRRLSVADGQETLELNPRSFRRREAVWQDLPSHVRLQWGRNRRVAQLVRVADGNSSAVVVNVHLTASPDSRLADAELLRAVSYAEGLARPREPVVVCGDLNLTETSSASLSDLVRWGYSPPIPGVDQIMCRGLGLARDPEPWPEERRRHGGALLSAHTPVDAEMIDL